MIHAATDGGSKLSFVCVSSMTSMQHRFVPTEDAKCGCGALLQTRKHILLDCPRYADARRTTLSRVAPSLTVNDIIGTQDGIRALAKFIAKTGPAFIKTGDSPVVDPHETVYETKSTRTRKRTRRNAALGNRRIHEGC